ncbi:helix-turn-helix domain-containing protein [Clostridium perfringens]
MNTIGERIKYIREDVLNLSGEEFGKMLNVTKTAVSNWENGNRTPDIHVLSKIASLGNVSLDYLACKVNNSNENNPVYFSEKEKQINNKLKLRIKEERIKLGLNQEEFGKMINVSKQAVSGWENGYRTPDVETLEKLAELLNCSVDYLIGRTNEKKEEIIKINKQHSEVTLGERVDSYLRENGINPDEMTEEQREEFAEQFVKMYITFHKNSK